MNLPKHTVVCDTDDRTWMCVGGSGAGKSWWVNTSTREYRPWSAIRATHIVGYGIEPVPLTESEKTAII